MAHLHILRGVDAAATIWVACGSEDEREEDGVQQPQGHIVHVSGLIQNETYVFAAGGYTSEGICVNGIGDTCSNVLTLLPLSLHQLSGYLAEIAFKLGHFTIAK